MENLNSTCTWINNLIPDVVDLWIFTDDCCKHIAFWKRMFPTKTVYVKKDPAHISDLVFRSFVGRYPDPDFEQEVKQRMKA